MSSILYTSCLKSWIASIQARLVGQFFLELRLALYFFIVQSPILLLQVLFRGAKISIRMPIGFSIYNLWAILSCVAIPQDHVLLQYASIVL